MEITGASQMMVGITYDLRHEYLAAGYNEEETAEFDRLETIETLEETLNGLGCDTERIGNVRQLASRLVEGARWDLVFNIAEGLHGVAREAQVPALLDAFAIPYTFSDPLVLALSLHKGMTKHLVRAMGIATPDFAVVETKADIARVDLPWPLFVKPIAEGTSKGISGASKVGSRAALETVCEALLHQFAQPVLVETFLPGRELTVGIVGTGEQANAIGVMEVSLLGEAEPDVYSYTNKAYYETRVRYHLVRGALAQTASEIALQVWRGLGCRDGGRVDLRCNAQGIPFFLELNPLPGLNREHSDLPILGRLLGMPYDTLIRDILTSATQRLAEGSRSPRTSAETCAQLIHAATMATTG
jgi:D-alanine-D-alanine ligase